MTFPKTIKFPVCEDDECAFRKDCANHETAGQFREDGGPSPLVTIDVNNPKVATCNGLSETSTGMLYLKDGELRNYADDIWD